MRNFFALIIFAIVSLNLSMLRTLPKFPRTTSRCLSAVSQPLTKAFEFDYLLESNRFIHAFEESDTEKSSVVEIQLVAKTKFNDWKRKSESLLSLQLLQRITGMQLKSFPGSKILSIPVKGIDQVTVVAFYDDTDSKSHYRLFDGFWSFLKNETYRFQPYDGSCISEDISDKLALSFALHNQKFNFFKSKPSFKTTTKLVWPKNSNKNLVKSTARAYTLMRDLVDSPALTLGPKELGETAAALGKELGAASIDIISGVSELETSNFPQIAAVGMASSVDREPRIIDIKWGSPARSDDNSDTGLSSLGEQPEFPEIVIIGKGVTFDTGGLNIKGMGMRNMKKDMAGAAQALALAGLIMETKLPVRLRLLLPIVENSISGAALRPGDVIKARNGKTTEITNTDAEGRLILADALVAAMEGFTPGGPPPSLVVDFATLTGAARVALGNDLPALFSNNEEAMIKLWKLSSEINDPVWIMPLWEPLRPNLKSSIADLVNAAEGAGAITAALYLSEFIAPPSRPKPSATATDADDEDSSEANSLESTSSEATATPPAAVEDATNLADDSSAASPTSEDCAEASAEESAEAAGAAVAPAATVWFHLDFMGSKGSRAEPQGMRAVYEYIKREFC